VTHWWCPHCNVMYAIGPAVPVSMVMACSCGRATVQLMVYGDEVRFVQCADFILKVVPAWG